MVIAITGQYAKLTVKIRISNETFNNYYRNGLSVLLYDYFLFYFYLDSLVDANLKLTTSAR